MQANTGKLEGTGEIRDKDGNLKGTFTLSSECSPEQARQLGLINSVENDNGDNTPNSDPK